MPVKDLRPEQRDRLSEEERSSIVSRLNRTIGQGSEPVRDLLDLEGIKGKTILTEEERMLLSQIRFTYEIYDIPSVARFVQHWEEYGISVDGISRKQFVAVHTQPAVLNQNLPDDKEDKMKEVNTGNRKM